MICIEKQNQYYDTLVAIRDNKTIKDYDNLIESLLFNVICFIRERQGELIRGVSKSKGSFAFTDEFGTGTVCISTRFKIKYISAIFERLLKESDIDYAIDIDTSAFRYTLDNSYINLFYSRDDILHTTCKIQRKYSINGKRINLNDYRYDFQSEGYNGIY